MQLARCAMQSKDNGRNKDAPGGALGCLMATANKSFSSRAAASAASLSFFYVRHTRETNSVYDRDAGSGLIALIHVHDAPSTEGAAGTCPLQHLFRPKAACARVTELRAMQC